MENDENYSIREEGPACSRNEVSSELRTNVLVANTPRSQAKSLHESPLQAVPILSALLACPLPLLRAQAPPATPYFYHAIILIFCFGNNPDKISCFS